MALHTIDDLLRDAELRLEKGGSDAGRLEAEVLLAHLRGCSRARLLADGQADLSDRLRGRWEELLRRRVRGEPLQFLTGVQEFWSLPFRVDRRVLIPRPETEGVVEEVLRRLRGAGPARIVDVGTGSGCIAVSLARELPQAEIIAVDSSEEALELARGNARALAPEASIRFFPGDLLAPLADLQGAIDLIVSNPPYVAAGEEGSLPREVREHEPRAALVAGETGLEVIDRLIGGAPGPLRTGGSLVLEIGAGQWPRVRERIRADGRYGEPTVRDDFQGIPRVVTAATEKR